MKGLLGRGLWTLVGTALLVVGGLPGEARAQVLPPVGREAALALEPEPLAFEPPSAELHDLAGIPVLFLRDPELPLVDIFARFDGGYAHFGRERYAAATALPGLLRSGGTERLPPDSVDELLDFHALHVSTSGGGGSVSASLNALRKDLDTALDLWAEILRRPRFDSAQVEIWRGQEMESVRRRADDPGRLAVTEFNRIMFGDHPVGWEMAPDDLEPGKVTPEILSELHRRILCRENLVLGVAGDVTWNEIRPRLEERFAGWPACPGELPERPDPEIRTGGGVFVIPREMTQTVVVMAHPTGMTRTHPDYFASRIANSILGGSGFGSRLMDRVRTREGYAYAVSSFWTAPTDHEGVAGALTRTRSEATVAATRLILEIVEELRAEPPGDDEVRTAVDRIANGFVFNFEHPAQIVSRELFYVAEDLPRDWLSRFLEGVQAVGPDDVHRVVRNHLHPDRMTILLVGDPEAFDEPPEVLGKVEVLDLPR